MNKPLWISFFTHKVGALTVGLLLLLVTVLSMFAHAQLRDSEGYANSTKTDGKQAELSLKVYNQTLDHKTENAVDRIANRLDSLIASVINSLKNSRIANLNDNSISNSTDNSFANRTDDSFDISVKNSMNHNIDNRNAYDEVAYAQVASAQCFADATLAYRFLQNQQKLQQLSEAQASKVNINKATEAELTSLKGIGSHKAQQIILYRDAYGPFVSVDDLAKVKGIGSKTVANNRARLILK